MIRLLILLIIFIATTIPAIGVPAYPNRVKVTAENGDTVEILLKGDEFQKFAISEDGYLLTPKNNRWYYIKKSTNSDINASDIPLQKSVSKIISKNLLKADSSLISGSVPQRNMVREKRQTIYGGISHALVILVEYPDKKFIKTKQNIYDLFNKIGYDDEKAEGSVRDYYNYASYGSFDLISDVYGPFTTKSAMDYYGGNQPNGNDNNALQLVIEAIENLPDDLDLSIYDNNNDGKVDNVHIIFAGYGEEAGAQSSAIWSHEYPHQLPITKNGYQFAGYSCTPELRSNMGSGISRIGVICHELGHAFGANDYYDVDYSTNGAYEGTGVWDLMASGSWNHNGICPANFNPYVKIKDFGWVKPTIPEESGIKTLHSYNDNPEVLRISTSNPDDFYLLEYRRQLSFDKGLPGEGVLIYHVHPQIENRRSSNTINNRHPQCLYTVCASYEECPMDTYHYGDINSAGCPFPGITNHTEFSPFSSPRAFQWNGNSPDFSLTNIKISNEFAQFDLSIENGDYPPVPTETLIYQESFENGLDQFTKESIEGANAWLVYPTNTLSTIIDQPKPFEGTRALMLCDGTKSEICSKSLLTSERITLNPDSSYVMTYCLRTKEPKLNGRHKFKLSVRNTISDEWDVLYETTESILDWTENQINLPDNLSNIYYQFSGEVLNSGIFIDDIKIMSIGAASKNQLNIEKNNITITTDPFSIVAHQHMNISIYDMSGKRVKSFVMTPFSSISPQLSKGMYIVCSDKGDRIKVVI